MHPYNLNALCLAIALVGCSARHDLATSAPKHGAHAATNPVASMAGTWNWVDEKTEIALYADGHWQWWKLKEQGGRLSEEPFMSGRWFVHEHDLYLRIDQHAQAGIRGVAAGMAMVFALKSVAPDTLGLNWVRANRDVTWTRVAAHSPANGSKPIP